MSVMTFSEAANAAIDEEMARDETIFVQGEEVSYGIFGVTRGLADKYGEERVRDTPISEAAIVGSAVGAAATGCRPIAEVMYCDFISIGFDQILNQAALMRYMFGGKVEIPVTIRTTEGAGIRVAAHHSKTLHTIFAHIPGIKVICPSTPEDAKGLLKSAIRDNNPVICFENKTLYTKKGEVPDEEDFLIPLGEAKVERSGEDVTIVATQAMLHKSLQAADQVEVSVEVINPRTLYPLDIETISESVDKTGRLIVADESWLSYGTHAEIITQVVEHSFFSLDAPIKRVGVKDVPIPFSPVLEDEVLPGVDEIVEAINQIT